MPRVKTLCEVDRQPRDDRDCLDCAARMGPQQDAVTGAMRHCPFNYPMIKALLSPPRAQKPGRASATMLTANCLRQSVWKITRDYASYPSQMWAALDGTFVHQGLERHNEEGVVAELKIVKRLASGFVLSGMMDRYIRSRATIEDYKTKEKPELHPNSVKEYGWQLNIYGWMIRTGCIIESTGEHFQGPVEKLVLYPLSHKAAGVPISVSVRSDEAVEAYVNERTRHYIAMQQDTEYVAPRAFRDPSRENFCKDWCPFVGRCVETGGPEEGE